MAKHPVLLCRIYLSHNICAKNGTVVVVLDCGRLWCRYILRVIWLVVRPLLTSAYTLPHQLVILCKRHGLLILYSDGGSDRTQIGKRHPWDGGDRGRNREVW